MKRLPCIQKCKRGDKEHYLVNILVPQKSGKFQCYTPSIQISLKKFYIRINEEKRQWKKLVRI